MNPDRWRKTLFVLLFLVFCGIWLYNLSQFMPKSQDNYYRQVDKTNTGPTDIQKGRILKTEWGYYLKDPIRNPFQPFFIGQQLKNQQANPIQPELVIAAPYKYIGILSGNKGACGILENATGKTYVVSPGDTLESIKILAINANYMKIYYQGNPVKLKIYE